MKREEISAGGVIIKKSGQSFQILLLKDKNNNWTFPKGLIEENEDKLSAAIREIGEEVGLTKIRKISELSLIKYWYKWHTDLINKTVCYFLFEELGDEKPFPQEKEGIQEVKWFTPDEAIKIVGYPKTNKPILEEVLLSLRGAK